MKKVLVTGGAGFIGAHLVTRLVSQSTEVVVLDNLKRASKAKAEALTRSGHVRLVEGDIRRFEVVVEAMRGADVVFHLAAQSNVMGAVVDPDYSITTNVLGTFNVLRGASESGVPKVRVHVVARGVRRSHRAASRRRRAAAREEPVRREQAVRRGVLPDLREQPPGGRGLAARERVRSRRQRTGHSAVATRGARGARPASVRRRAGHRLSLGRLEVTRSKSAVVRTAAREIEVAKFIADTRRMRGLGLVPEADPLAHLAELVEAYPGSARA
jgi:NAD(P)-dependent dehydrogenase (short-subunit alcohol dehydrogenase family)